MSDDARKTLLDSELTYWKRELSLDGEHGDYLRSRLSAENRKQEHPTWITQYINYQKSVCRGDEVIKALDLGSGPLSNLAWAHETGLLDVTAADPLGDSYGDLIRELGIDYPLLPSAVGGEDLLEHFGPASFHIVYSRNAMDHAADIQQAFAAVNAVLKPQGMFFLEGNANEGARWNYYDLHRYSFFATQGKLCCFDRTEVEQLDLNALDMVQVKMHPVDTRPFNPDDPVEWIHAVFQQQPADGSDPIHAFLAADESG